MAATTTAGSSSNHLADLAASHHDHKIHLLLAASGSVATIKIPNIIQALSRHCPHQLKIRVIFTTNAQHFLGGQSEEQPPVADLRSMPGVEAVYDDPQAGDQLRIFDFSRSVLGSYMESEI